MFWIGLVLGGMFGIVAMSMFNVASRGDNSGNN